MPPNALLSVGRSGLSLATVPRAPPSDAALALHRALGEKETRAQRAISYAAEQRHFHNPKETDTKTEEYAKSFVWADAV